MDTEYQAGVEMGKYFADKGIKTVAVYGAFIPNPMHVYRVAGVLSGLGVSYRGATVYLCWYGNNIFYTAIKCGRY